MPNDQLARALGQVKSGNRMQYALVLKGGGGPEGTDGVLLVDKKISDGQISTAKKKCGGSLVADGECYSEQGAILFLTTKQPQPGWAKAAKAIAADDAKVTITAKFALDPAASGKQPPPPSPTTGPAKLDDVKLKSSDLAQEWETEHDKLAPEVDKILTGQKDSPLAKQIEAVYFKAVELAKAAKESGDQGDFAQALTGLRAVAEIIHNAGKAPSSKERQVTFETYTKELEKTKAKLKELKEADKDRANLIEQDLKNAEALGKIGDHAKAVPQLRRLYTIIVAALDGKKWEGKSNDAIAKNKYTQGKVLKSGGFGTVTLLNPTEKGVPSLVFKSPNNFQARESLEHEKEVYEQIGEHPNIARCLGMKHVGTQEGLVMEAISGGDMDSAMKTMNEKLAKGEITQAEFWGVMQFTMLRTLEVLDHMSSKGFTHADIKPDNIMYDAETGEIKVIDMGIAAKKGEAQGGTAGFMAPETLGDGGGEKADVFSVGATAYNVGEKERFKYGLEGKIDHPLGPMIAAAKYAMKSDSTPLKPEDDSHSASTVDPETGERKKVAGRFGVSSDYVKFLEWALHPDPKKRPTAKEALEHPFMKDRIISEDQARDLIKGMQKGPEPKPAPKRDIGSARGRVDEVVRQIKTKQTHISTVNRMLADLKPAEAGVAELTKSQSYLAEFEANFLSFAGELNLALKALKKAVPTNPAPGDEQAAADKDNLESLEKLEGDLKTTMKDLETMQKQVAQALADPKSVKEQASLVAKGKLLTADDVKRRKKVMDDQLAGLKTSSGRAAGASSQADLYAVELRQLGAELAAAKDHADQEAKAVTQLGKDVAGKKPGALAGKSDKAAFAAAVHNVAELQQAITAHQNELATLMNQTATALSNAEKDLKTKGLQVDNAIAKAGDLVKDITQAQDDFKKDSVKCQNAAKLPKTSTEEKNAYEKERKECLEALNKYEPRIRTQLEKLPAATDELRKLQAAFSAASPTKERDFYGDVHDQIEALTKVVHTISELRNAISKDRAKLPSTENA